MDHRDLDLRFNFAQGVVREAGQAALDLYRRRETLAIERKGRQDFVSVADRECEAFVLGALRRAFPDDAALGEEGGMQNAGGNSTWIVDPIDGTSNFIAGIPLWCVSLGFVVDRKAVLGIVYNPVTEELYAARSGGGALLNGRRIRASAASRLDEARLGLGFSYRRPVKAHVDAVAACLDAGCEYTRFGSGALGMVLTADGRLDGYYEAHINAWDVAAGLVLVAEAGGWCSDFLGAPDALANGNAILAAAPGLVAPLRALLAV
ncbi:MAG TPA: inositol monophosphatase family protein [Dongiaceae bacterium]